MVGTGIETKEEKTPGNYAKSEHDTFSSRIPQNISNENDGNIQSSMEKTEHLDRISGFAVGIGSLYLQEALGYPFIVLRHQCQVNHSAVKYHILPFSLFRVIGRIHHRQGTSVFWKGWGSVCICKGATILTEVGVCELLHVPRTSEKTHENGPAGFKAKAIHETLKGVSLLITLPLFSAALVESVHTLAFDESRGLFTFCKDALHRIAGIYSSRGHGRLLPLYSLLLPSILYGVLRYTVKSIVTYLINQVQIKRHRINQGKRVENLKKQYYTELASNFYASLLTDMLMFPLETVILRLHIQGTRTIIDDTDKGIGVVPLCTNYEGMSDCMSTIRREEGVGGFFKGLGALLLQYFVQGVIVKLAKPLYREA